MFKRMPRLAVCSTVAVVALLAVVCGLVLAANGSAAFARPVQVIGCSNSSLIAQSYDQHSKRHVVVNSASGGLTLASWADGNSKAWNGGIHSPGFDSNYQRFGATAVWYPLCIRVGDYATNATAFAAFTTFLTLLRTRTSAPLYVSSTIGSQPSCAMDDNAQMDYVANRAVNEGLALRGPVIPPASAPDAKGCHFDPVLSTNVADAAIAFLDTR
jgi:hypothetical protein